MMERLYAAACSISENNEGGNTYLSGMAGLKSFATALAGHLAPEVAIRELLSAVERS
jgi:hypothetical protein